MSRKITIAVEGVCKSGKSTLLREIHVSDKFTTVQRAEEIFYDEDGEVVQPWQYFLDDPKRRGFRYIQTRLLRNAEDMSTAVSTQFKVVEGSMNTTRYVTLKLADSLGMEDDDVEVAKRWYKLLSKEASLTPDMFVVLSPTRSEFRRRLGPYKSLAKHWRPHEMKDSWDRFMAEFKEKLAFRDKVVVIQADHPSQMLEDFYAAVAEKFPI